MSAAMLLLMFAAGAGAGPDTVVVCPAEFRQALDPWLQLRAAEGHTLRIVSNDGTPDDIRARIRAAARQSKVQYVLLVGGADPRAATEPAVRRRSIPAHLETAKVDVHYGSEPQIGSDNWYADLGDTGVPDLAIGRLTVRSTTELQAVVRKIVAYEQSTDFRRWRSRINFVAGTGGFGPVIDSVLEGGARQLICAGIPETFQTTLTSADWHSPYCPDPRRFHATTLARLNEGCWFWVYLGHAGPTALDALRVPDGRQPILERADAAGLHCANGSPIGLLLACYAGAFDGPQRCLADELLRADGGPVAIVAGSRVTMPYGMTVLGSELLDECFERHAATLGDALLHAKRRTVGADGAALSARRLMFDTIAQTLSPPGSDLAAERQEHLHLFNLIGDPLLRLRYPQSVELKLPSTAKTGGRLTVAGRSPVDGVCTIELSTAPDRSVWRQPARQQYNPSPEALAAYQTVYQTANCQPLARIETRTAGGHFSAELPIPAETVGHCLVRVFIAGGDDYALGAAGVAVAAADEKASSLDAAAAGVKAGNERK